MYLWNINFLGWVQAEGFPLWAQRWYQKHTPDREVRFALPSLLKRQPKLEHLNGFSAGLCSVILSQKSFMLSGMFGSLLLHLSSESWLILKAEPSHLCFVCSLLTLGCSSCCSSLLPWKWHATDTRWHPGSQLPHRGTLHFISNCFRKLFQKMF